MKKLKRHEPHDLHPCVYVCIADHVAELEAALAEAVELLRELFDPSSTDRGSGYGQRAKAFLDKHGGEDR